MVPNVEVQTATSRDARRAMLLNLPVERTAFGVRSPSR